MKLMTARADADNKMILADADNQIKIKTAKADLEEVIEKLKKRETDLYKYKFKIKDLRKSKHVLTHRAQEMRESLKPKD